MPENNACSSPKLLPEANVTIAIKGLAMCGYNETSGNWEAIFPRHVENHNLTLTINKCRAGRLESGNSYRIEPNGRIFIRPGRAIEPTAPRYDRDGDEKSLDAVVDFADPDIHGGQIAFKKGLNLPKTFLSISGSVFYTKALSRRAFHIVKKGAQTPVRTRKIGLVIGADIVCENGAAAEITVEGKPGLINPLVAEQGVVYEIIFDNDCRQRSAHAEGDFIKYYDLIRSDEPVTLNLADSPDSPDLLEISSEPEDDEPPLPPLPPLPDDEQPKLPPCNAVIISDLGDEINSLEELLEY